MAGMTALMLLVSPAQAVDDPLIREHLLYVADTLEAETPHDLDPIRRAARMDSLHALRSYAWAGDYPNNPGFTRRALPARAPRVFDSLEDAPRAPVFVDEHGTHCAVGYLIALDAPELVERVATRHDLAYLAEMDEPGLAVWADAHGFTLDELAWIQPDYFPLYVNWCRDRPPLDLAATALGPDSCDTSTVTSVCADTCRDGISVFAPIVWEGDEPVTATFELFGDRAVEATLEPGVPLWLGPLVVNEREVEWIRGEGVVTVLFRRRGHLNGLQR